MFFSIILFQLLDDVLINGVNHIDDFDSFLFQRLDERGVGDSLFGLSGDEVDILLSFFHAAHIVFQRDLLVSGLAGVVTEEFG